MGKSRKRHVVDEKPSGSVATKQHSGNVFVQKPIEMLLVGASSPDPYSIIVVDPRTGVAAWSYKGSELQGATASSVLPLGNTGEHFIIAVKDRPLLNCLAVHNRDRFHAKAVVAGAVSCMVCTRDGTLFFASIGSKIYAWLLSCGEMLCVVDAHYQAITQLALSTDESLLISTSQDGAVHVYIVSQILSVEHDKDFKPIRKWQAHTLKIKSLSVSHGQDTRIATCGIDHIATIYSISLDASLLKVSADRPLTCCTLDPAETRLFIGSDLGNIAQINLYNLKNRNEILVQTCDERNEAIPVFNGHSDEISSLAVNGDGAILASADITGRYCLWDIGSRQCLRVSTMRGAVTTLSFVPNWPTFSSSESSVMWRPVFDLQRNPSSGSKIQLSVSTIRTNNQKEWRNLTDNLLERHQQLLAAKTTTTTNTPSSKRKTAKTNGVAIADEDIEAPSESLSLSSLLDDDRSEQEKIEHLMAENKRLRKINAELYSFSAKQILQKE